EVKLGASPVVDPPRPYFRMKAFLSAMQGVLSVVGFYLIRLSIDAETPSGQPVGKAAHRYAVKNLAGADILIDMIETQDHVGRLPAVGRNDDADDPRAIVAQGHLHAALIIQYNKV